MNHKELRWWDAPKDSGPHKTLCNRWKRWGEMGILTRMMEGLLSAGAERKTAMIDAAYFSAHRTASSLAAKREISAA